MSRAAKGFAEVSAAGVLLAALVGLFIGVSIGTFDYAEGTSYLSNDPAACVNCHIMREQHDSWMKGPHHAVATCNDCHVPANLIGKYWVKAEHGFRHSKGFTFQDFHEPIQIKDSSLEVVQNNCVRCHQGMVGQISAHMGEGEKINCVHCHAGIGHGPRR